MTLKLYYWDAVIAVGNYGPGEVVIMANSKKEVKGKEIYDKIIKKYEGIN